MGKTGKFSFVAPAFVIVKNAAQAMEKRAVLCVLESIMRRFWLNFC